MTSVVRHTLAAFSVGVLLTVGGAGAMGCSAGSLCDCDELEERIPSGAFEITAAEAPNVDLAATNVVEVDGDEVYVEYAIAGTNARVGIVYAVLERVID